jgi:hypothetical protein
MFNFRTSNEQNKLWQTEFDIHIEAPHHTTCRQHYTFFKFDTTTFALSFPSSALRFWCDWLSLSALSGDKLNVLILSCKFQMRQSNGFNMLLK